MTRSLSRRCKCSVGVIYSGNSLSSRARRSAKRCAADTGPRSVEPTSHKNQVPDQRRITSCCGASGTTTVFLMDAATMPDAPVVLRLVRHHQALRAAPRQRCHRPRTPARRDPCAPRRERRRQDDADEHPLRPLRCRRRHGRGGGRRRRARAAPARVAACGAQGRRRHGPPALYARRESHRPRQHHARHRAGAPPQPPHRCGTPARRSGDARVRPRRSISTSRSRGSPSANDSASRSSRRSTAMPASSSSTSRPRC